MPGPKGHFLVGSLPEIRRDVLGFFARCAREYGDVTGFSLLHMPYCFVNHPALIEQVLVADPDRVIKTWDLRQLRVALGDGLLTLEGDAWRRQRRVIQPAFHKERVDRYGEVMVARTERMLETWRDGASRDLHKDLMHLTFEIVAESLFGADVSRQAAAMERALGEFMEGFESMLKGWLPLPLSWPAPGNLRARRAGRRIKRMAMDLMRERRRRAEPGADMLAWLLAARDESGAPISDVQIRDHVATFLTAGHETTAEALSWTIYLLARHPEVEAELLGELRAVLNGGRATAENAADLRFTRQVIQESMRMFPPAWGMGREAAREMELGGYRIRPGTQVFIVHYVMHRDPRFFPEPERFLPQRWAPENAARVPKFAYLPFGIGPRHCIGSQFSLMEATLLLATILRRFHVALVPDHPIALQPSVTLRPRYGIRVTLHER